MSPLVQSLLEKRGITDVEQFLKPEYTRDTHDPFLLADMHVATDRVFKAIAAQEKIAIYADYDCDGIPGAALLYTFLKKIKYENIEVYIPHRDNEGYGFHAEAIDILAGKGVTLVITVDVGTVAHESILYAKQKGVDVVVTDHHEIGETLPECIAVLNPKRVPYPFSDLCGTAVAYKLVQALIYEGKKRHIPEFLSIVEGWEKWLLDLVAIATIADMVPLLGENRTFAHFGLTVLRKSPRLGIKALCERVRLRQHTVTEDDIGFSIAPRINAASRMDKPELAFRLLVTTDVHEAQLLAAELDTLNTRRKGVVAAMVKDARKRVQNRYNASDTVVVVGDTEWKPALAGLAANSLLEGRRVACVWGKDAKGNLKGSCRSDGSVSVVDMFARSGVLSEFGGHAASGGFTVSHEHVHVLAETLASCVVSAEKNTQKCSVDIAISARELGKSLSREVGMLAPFGLGNPKPVVQVSRVVVRSSRRFGKEENHTEVLGVCENTGHTIRAFQYFASPDDFSCVPETGKVVHLLGTLEKDAYRGGFSLRVIDILSS